MSPRSPGDVISKELVRDLRTKHGLSQDQFAQRLGVKGGKSVVSAWEGGRAPCEGPVAELVLALFAGRNVVANITQLLEEAEKIWRRSSTHQDAWRQITAVPEDAVKIEAMRFAKLFPEAALTHKEHAHGFPTVDYELPANVYGIDPSGWYGVIPVERERAPQWIWAMKRTGEFYYREVPWEDKPDSITRGHIHVGSLLGLTLQTVFFLRKLAGVCDFPDSTVYTLQLDMEGVTNRGLVGYVVPAPDGWYRADSPMRVSPNNHLHASTRATISDMKSDPLEVGYNLVAEMALLLRPDFADRTALAEQLKQRHKQDDDGSKYRFLGFLDPILKKKK